MIALKGTLITPSEIIKNGVLIINGSRIGAVGRSDKVEIPVGAEIIDCKDKFIAPGFIDVHVQGAGGCDILDGTYDAINTITKTLAKNGTTSFLATTVYSKRNQAPFHAVKKAMKEGTAGAEVLGVHLEGPFINPAKCGMITKANIVDYTPKKIDEIIDICSSSLKMMTVAPESKGAIDLIKRLKKNKVIVAIGHTDATYEEALMGFDAGITHATHMFNAMRGLHHRSPGAVGAILTDERISVQLIADGKHLDRKSTRLNSSHTDISRMPSSA